MSPLVAKWSSIAIRGSEHSNGGCSWRILRFECSVTARLIEFRKIGEILGRIPLFRINGVLSGNYVTTLILLETLDNLRNRFVSAPNLISFGDVDSINCPIVRVQVLENVWKIAHLRSRTCKSRNRTGLVFARSMAR